MGLWIYCCIIGVFYFLCCLVSFHLTTVGNRAVDVLLNEVQHVILTELFIGTCKLEAFYSLCCLEATEQMCSS